MVYTPPLTGALGLVAGNGGGGTVVLTASNTFTGNTAINAGTLMVGPGGSLGSGGTYGGVIGGTGGLTLNSGGGLTLTGSSGYGLTTVTAGTLTVAPAGVITDALSNGGLTVSGPNAVANIQGDYDEYRDRCDSVPERRRLDLTGSVTCRSSVRISGGMVNIASGVMTFNAASNVNFWIGYNGSSSGTVNVSGGTLDFAAGAAFNVGGNNGDSGTLNIGGNGVVIVSSSTNGINFGQTDLGIRQRNQPELWRCSSEPPSESITSADHPSSTLAAARSLPAPAFPTSSRTRELLSTSWLAGP